MGHKLCVILEIDRMCDYFAYSVVRSLWFDSYSFGLWKKKMDSAHIFCGDASNQEPKNL